MPQSLNGGALILTFGLHKIDSLADIGDRDIAIDFDLSGFNIEGNLRGSHAGFPEQRELGAEALSRPHVATADELAARHAKIPADNFAVSQTALAQTGRAVAQCNRAGGGIERFGG